MSLKKEIKLMLSNFEATVPWRKLYKRPTDNTDVLIDLIKKAICDGENTKTKMLYYIRATRGIDPTTLGDLLASKLDVLWYTVPGKKNTVHYHLIDDSG